MCREREREIEGKNIREVTLELLLVSQLRQALLPRIHGRRGIRQFHALHHLVFRFWFTPQQLLRVRVFALGSGVHKIWVQNKTRPLTCVFTFGLKIGPHQAWGLGLVCQIRRSITLSGDGQDFAGHWCHIRATSFFHTWDPDPYVRSVLVQSLALDQKVNSILGFLGFGP